MIGIVVLAAGGSTRMGEPKQLLRYEGMTLLGRAVSVALGSRCRPVVVVLGAGADGARAEVDPRARVVVNEAWAEGMGSSIRCGVAALGEAAAAVVTLCDQPFVTSELIDRLVEAHLDGGALVVASEYDAAGERTRGVPALFDRALFPELLALSGAQGAKRVVERHASDLVTVPAPEAAFDVDTPDDYGRIGHE